MNLLAVHAVSAVLCAWLSLARGLRWTWALLALVACVDVTAVALVGVSMGGPVHLAGQWALDAWYLTKPAVASAIACRVR